MSNKNLFSKYDGLVKNEAGGDAFKLDPKSTLALYAATSCLNNTFYTSGESQLKDIISLCSTMEPEFIAKVAVFSRHKSNMKDMPALLCAILASRKENALLKKIFSRCINNGKMLRNFVQIIRSGVTGRKSLGTAPKKLVQNWFNSRTPDEIFMDSIGQNPSLSQVLALSHPNPMDQEKNALYGWLRGREDFNYDSLPTRVKDYDNFKKGNTKEVPDVPFEMLTGLDIDDDVWFHIAKNAGWHWLRMNLNTMIRHNVFKHHPEMVDFVAEKLSNRKLIPKNVFPYQIMASYLNSSEELPTPIRSALQEAMEIATENVPVIDGVIDLCVDVSASMNHSVTGHRKGSTSAMRFVDVAALMACTLLRKNPNAVVIPFNTNVVKCSLDPKDTVLTNAKKLSDVCGGGTACSSALRHLNNKKSKGDLVVMFSDNQSWAESANGTTPLMNEWKSFKERNGHAVLACVDIAPYATVQAKNDKDILHVSGWNDSVFEVLNYFMRNQLTSNYWVDIINKVTL